MLNVTLNESEIIKNVLNGKLDNYNIVTILQLLLKYYYIEGMRDKLLLREQLLNFLKNNYEGYKRGKWEDIITKMTASFLKTIKQNKVEVKLIDINCISVTQSELDTISILNDIKLEKLAFIMLAYAKISNIVMNNSDGWINKSCSTICKEARVNIKGNEKEKVFHEFYIRGLIEQRKRNNKTNMKVCYIDYSSDIVINITDFDKVINYYILWKNKDMIPCESCGKPIKKDNPNRKYCSKCYTEIRKEQFRVSSKKRYSQQSANSDNH